MNLVPRVAYAFPRHRIDQQPPQLRNWASAPSLGKDSEARGSQNWPNYLPRAPSLNVLEKELTNNRIKIMNMKTDYNRLKNLVKKIETRSQSNTKARGEGSLLKKRAKRGINGTRQKNQFGQVAGLKEALSTKVFEKPHNHLKIIAQKQDVLTTAELEEIK